MPGKIKGSLTASAYRHFGTLPSPHVQEQLQKSGWKFEVIHGSGRHFNEMVNQIYHPDGKPLDGLGAPGYCI